MREDEHPYTPLWSKYRPAILKMMSAAAAEGAQEYRLYGHEFKAFSKKEKTFSFMLEAQNGRAINNVKKSQVAQDLLHVLQQSPKAQELLGHDAYEFSLDKSFIFRVNRKAVLEHESN